MNWKCWIGMHEWDTEKDYIERGTFKISGKGGKNKLEIITQVRKIHQVCLNCGNHRVIEEPWRKRIE